MEDLPESHTRLRGALSGVVASIAALGFGELVSGLLRSTASPIVSVGSVVIDHVPPGVKTFAVRTFGTGDKRALLIGTTALLLALAAGLGAASVRRWWIAPVGVVALGLVGAAAAATRPGAGAAAVLPSVIGSSAALAALAALRPIRGEPVVSDRSAAGAVGLDRRRFLMTAAGATAAAAGAGGIGRWARRRFEVSAARRAVVLPAPASPAASVPAGADLGVPGVASFLTSNADFYRIDTTLITPQVDPSTWRLKIHGLVEHPMTLTYDDLLGAKLIERDITMVCVSNEVGGSYAGTARWLGVGLNDVLRRVGVSSRATQLVSRSVDGWTAGSPVDAVMDGRDAMIAIGMNGEPLPVAHGFPARLVVPGLYGFVSATKWVTDLELTTFEAYDPYWARRGWAKQAPIKTMARIDTPRGLAHLAAGRVVIAGVAWAVHRGIGRVEVRIDDGAWQAAELAPAPGPDTWRQWRCEWDAAPGSHRVTVRAADANGSLQTEQRAAPIPDGAAGWHTILVLVDG